MRKFVSVAGLAAVLCLMVPASFAGAPPTKNGQGTIVIIFKDGHRQTFNLADVSRVEFPQSGDSASSSATTSSNFPRHFLGKWEVGDGGGNNFFITLYDNGDAKRSTNNMRGKWAYVDGEAQITWDDGWHDAIRKVGSGFEKRAFGSGKTFTDDPDNVAAAHNTTPHPI